MRKCLRCGAEMVPCAIRPEGCTYGLQIKKHVTPFEGRSKRMKAAVCPKCGEISLFTDEPSFFEED